jgi:hypothetical protein
VSAFIHHWVIVDLWDNMWSNIMAPSAITLAAIGISHLRLKIHQRKLHEEMLDKQGLK